MKIIFKSGIKIAVAVLFSLAIIPSNIVHATSEFDTVVVPAASWAVTDDGGIVHTANLADAINNVTDPQLKQTCQALYASFMQRDYRTYDVYQPYNNSQVQYARAFATDEKPAMAQWSADPNDPSGQKRVHALWHGVIGFKVGYVNGNVVATDCGDGGSNYADINYGIVFSNGYMPVMTYQTQNFAVDNYPAGYAGDSVPSSAISGQISGDVQCANTKNIISAIHINAQSGLSGDAKITDDGMGGKYYRYYLSQESPYYLTVLCDGDIFTGPTVNSNFYNNYSWVCTNTVPGQDGNLHICAAS